MIINKYLVLQVQVHENQPDRQHKAEHACLNSSTEEFENMRNMAMMDEKREWRRAEREFMQRTAWDFALGFSYF